jgi:hypothetical protein
VSGPLLNLLIGIALFIVGHALHASCLTIFGYFRLATGLWTLCPIPTMDGWVIGCGLLGRSA